MSGQASSGTKGRTASRPLALVTGASAGLGAAFARAYAQRGFDVALTARREARLRALADELNAAHGIEALVIPADLARFEGHAPVLAAIADQGRVVDVLVNNAGFGVAQDFTAVPWERQRDFLMTLAVAPCGLAYGVIPGMAERGRGAIINVASLAGFAPGVAGNSLYPGVKSLMIKFSQSLDAEYRLKGIKVTALCPGFTKTEFAEVAGIQAAMESAPRLFWQSAEAVVEAAIRANDAGRVVIVPGWHNKLAAFLMRRLPQGFVRAAIAVGSSKYRVAGEAI
ncbi:MAG TPA: SDR family oxidoreductase [Caulobacteraceae bacterium]|nr:SDR family oxidoreductase [Caulobacteraceae bacterium]